MTKHIPIAAGLGALAMLASTGAAAAQQGQQAAAQPMAAQQGQAQQADRTVVGRVVDTRAVQLQGIEEKHDLVKIEQEGKRLVVDLGAMDQQQMDLKKGDILFVAGRSGRIGDKPVLVAKWAGEIHPAGRNVATQGGKQ